MTQGASEEPAELPFGVVSRHRSEQHSYRAKSVSDGSGLAETTACSGNPATALANSSDSGEALFQEPNHHTANESAVGVKDVVEVQTQ